MGDKSAMHLLLGLRGNFDMSILPLGAFGTLCIREWVLWLRRKLICLPHLMWSNICTFCCCVKKLCASAFIKDFWLILLSMQCFFDTPGLMLKKSGFPYNDIKVRNESAWSSVSLYDVLIVVFDVHRHLTRFWFPFSKLNLTPLLCAHIIIWYFTASYLIRFSSLEIWTNLYVFLQICPLSCILGINIFLQKLVVL